MLQKCNMIITKITDKLLFIIKFTQNQLMQQHNFCYITEKNL